MVFEHQSLTNTGNDKPENCHDCKKSFEQIKTAMKHFQLEIKFEDTIVSNKEKILEFLLDSEDTKEDDDQIEERTEDIDDFTPEIQ